VPDVRVREENAVDRVSPGFPEALAPESRDLARHVRTGVEKVDSRRGTRSDDRDAGDEPRECGISCRALAPDARAARLGKSAVLRGAEDDDARFLRGRRER
jgi:hypothetical protein